MAFIFGKKRLLFLKSDFSIKAMHHHHPEKARDINQRNLLISAMLNFCITIAEIIGGIFSNSLALISDALHNMGDTSAIVIAYFANLISRRDYTDKKTFGYKRIEILAALLNAIILVVIIIYLFIEAVNRLKNPEPIKGLVMFTVALVGFAANIVSVWLLKKDSMRNLNIKAAYIHLLGDTISSVLVIVSALIIYAFQIYWIDPLITLLLGIYLLKETYEILRQAVDILMQGTPEGMEISKVKMELETISEIDNVHHMHVWKLTDNEIHFECHVDLKEDIKLSDTEIIRSRMQEILKDRFNISHVTIQCEYNCCEDKNLIHQR
jgi:cobalt-zinc-cadmium efflux system protein